MYEKNNGNNVSYDALLSQAGIAPAEPVGASADEPQKSPEEKRADALRSAKALADLPGMPGFLKPTHTLAAIEGARTEEEKRAGKDAENEADKGSGKSKDGVSTVTTTGTDGNGQAFKVTVMVSPDSETSAEAEALRESATSSKPAPITFSSSYTAPDSRYSPQNQAAGSGFGSSSRPSMPLNGNFDGMSFASAPASDPFGFASNPSVALGAHNSIPFAPNNDAPFGSDPALGGLAPSGAPLGGSLAGPAGGIGASNHGSLSSLDPMFSSSSSGLPLSDPFAPPRAEDVAAAQVAAAHAARNAAMVDMMAAYGPDAVSDEAKKHFFGKKKRERAAQKAAEEAAAYAAATAAAAAEAAAAEEIARHQPTAYVPVIPPSQFGNASAPKTDPFAEPQMTGPADSMAPMGAPVMEPTGMPEVPQPNIPVQPPVDMSGYDQLTSALPNVANATSVMNPIVAPSDMPYQPNVMVDPSVTTGIPAVGQMDMLDANGSYFGSAKEAPGYDQYGYALDGSGMTPEGVAALEAMRTDMNDASASHKKRMRNIKIIIASVVGAIAAAAIIFGILIATNVISLDDLGIHIESGVREETQSSSSSSGFSASLSYHSASSANSSAPSASSSASSETPEPSSPSSPSDPSAGGGGGGAEPGGSPGGSANGAGDEIYHYSLTTIDGEKPQVTEVVSYDENGMCLQTAMDAVFSSATAAQAFVERVRSDYGSNFLSGSVDGTTAHVVVNMARSKLTREGYENALRNVVDGLEIERLA